MIRTIMENKGKLLGVTITRNDEKLIIRRFTGYRFYYGKKNGIGRNIYGAEDCITIEDIDEIGEKKLAKVTKLETIARFRNCMDHLLRTYNRKAPWEIFESEYTAEIRNINSPQPIRNQQQSNRREKFSKKRVYRDNKDKR